MPPSADSQHRAAAIARVRTALIEKKMTQSELADRADCHEKTIQNMLAGRTVRDQTLFDVAVVLGLDFEELKATWSGHRPLDDSLSSGRHGEREPIAAVPSHQPGEPSASREIAPLYMGAYSKAAVDHLIGSYLTLRPSFTKPGLVIAYRTDITWDAGWPSLLFEETHRPDATYSHRGRLHVPASSPFIHLVSLTKGAMRMVMVSQLDQLGRMNGLITTVAKSGATMLPVSAPIVYVRRDDLAAEACGEFGPDTTQHANYSGLLTEAVVNGYVKLIDGVGLR